jgi:hypothetical protein
MTKKRETTTEMNVQDQVKPEDEAQKIWDQLDAEETGQAPGAAAQEQAPNEEPAQPADPATAAPAPAADANKGGEEAAPSEQQVLLDKIAGLESMLGQVTQRLRHAEGHIGGLNSQLKQQLQAAQQVATKGGEAPSAKEIRDAQANPEAMDALKRDYPEFASAMESALNERLSVLEQRLAQHQPTQQQPVVGPNELQRMRAELQVEVRHPGWQSRVQTPEFVGWLQRQPREVQMLAASESPQDAVRLLDLHTDAMSSATSQRTQRLSAAAAIPSGRPGAQARTKAVEDMSPEEYWRYLDELDRQKRN